MPASVRLSIISIVNEVQRRLGVNPTAALDSTKHSRMLMQMLNEIIAEVNDYGRWQDLYEEVIVTASSSIRQYVVRSATREIQSIIEVSFDGQPAQLENRPIEDIRRLRRVGSTGNPRQYAVIGVDASANPIIEVFPMPTTSQHDKTFDIAVQAKEPLYAVADLSAVPTYPANVLLQGLYAKALLEENGGERTNQYEMAFREFQNLTQQAQRRFTADTEDVMTFTPHRWG